jgi:hypothetical protein
MPGCAHSCRRATIGLSLAARRAGLKPKITPMAAGKKNDRTLMPRLNTKRTASAIFIRLARAHPSPYPNGRHG